MTDPALTERVAGVATAARAAAFKLARTSGDQRNQGLLSMARMLRAWSDPILEANAEDVEAAAARGTPNAMLDRLRLSTGRIDQMAGALEAVVSLPDPLGRVDEMWTRPNGLRVGKRRIPLGVVGIIYEARPNVTSDAAGLCFKSGNAVVLKGGSEAIRSNTAIVQALKQGLEKADLPAEALGFIDVTDRDAVRCMLGLDETIDLVIPRGGEGLIRFVSEHARMPVIKHYKGVCHVYVDSTANLDMALDIVVNAKCQRPSVCNSAETLLVDSGALESVLRPVADALFQQGVKLHGCPRTIAFLGDHPQLVAAEEDDWHAEYLSLDLAVKVVDGIDNAIEHIRRYGSLHTEAIVTSNYLAAEQFLSDVDSSTVLVNASTRFADGGELGLGAEIGISTTKLHAFGPMGLRELTTTKFVVYGRGQTRQ